MCKHRSIHAQSTPGPTVCCRLQGKIAMYTQLALHGTHLFPAACPSESLHSPTEHNSLWETHTLSDSCFSSVSLRQKLLIIQQLTVHWKKYCLISHRGQAQSPSTLQLLSHDLQGYVASFLGGLWSTQVESRNRAGWSIHWQIDWCIGSTNTAVRC